VIKTVDDRVASGLGRSDVRPVEVRGLVKRYGGLTVVDHVDLTIERGDVYAFLGPNGAGKTTTLRTLLGLIRRDAGSVSLFGRGTAPS
jgi:ABC-2 type transport system ATP-binding protein